MKKKISFLLIAGMLATLAFSSACSNNQPVAVAQPAPVAVATEESAPAPKQRSFDVLSHHDTNAVFSGTRKHTCLGRTSLCPDKCGHSGTLAVFKIEKYNVYKKPGQYGDPKSEEFVFMLKSTTGRSDVSKEIAERVNALKAGDKVHLVWEHIYITDENGSKYPERPIRKLSPL